MFFLILFLNYNVYSQLNSDLKLYYKFTNEAELMLIEKNYIGAALNYELAFKNKKIPFSKDRYNLSVCYAILKKNRKSLKNILFLVELGYPIDSLSKNQYLKPILKKYDTRIRKKCLQKYNNTYRNKIDSLYIRDQYFRKDEKNNYDSIIKVDYSNAIYLNKLIDKFGFPSEEKIGLYPNFDSLSFFILVNHNFSGVKYEQNYDYSDIIYCALYNGDIDAEIAAPLISGSLGKDIYGTFMNGIIRFAIYDSDELNFIKKNSLTKSGLPKINESKLNDINNLRLSIGLETIQDYRKKVVFQQNNKNFKIVVIGNKKVFILSENEYNLKISKIDFIE